MSYRFLSFFLLSLILVTGLTLWAVPASEAAAATFYISPNGNNANAGTSASVPWKTFAYAIPKLNPGDTLLIKEGTYIESIRDAGRGGTSWSSPITIAAYPGHTVTLRPSGGGWSIDVSWAG